MKLVSKHEGFAELLVPEKIEEDGKIRKAEVFYNPVMEIERDISILAFQSYQKEIGKNIKICDLMTGCGARGIRYALEIKGIEKVIINDLNPSAISLAKRNVIRNKIDKKVSLKCFDSNVILNMYAVPGNRFDIIDIDPFGSPAPFLDSAVRAIKNGGLLAITATDLAPLCGAKPIACRRKYGGKPLRTEYCHEIGARILIGSLVSIAARNDLAIKILLCYHSHHFTRVYALINRGILAANKCLKEMGYIAHCFDCLNREMFDKLSKIKSSCNVCGKKFSFAGPLWLGELYDKDFCRIMLDELEKRSFNRKFEAQKILREILVEKQECPLFYVVDKICSKLKIKTVSVKEVVKELELRGFENSITHFHKAGFRTNAKIFELKSIFKELSMRRAQD